VSDHGEALRDFVDRKTILQVGGGFAVAGLVLYLLVDFVGTADVVAELARADPRWVAAGCLSTLLGLAAWGKAWQIVLHVSGVTVPYRRLLVTYFAATFANYVTPMGQAGGEPFIAYVLSRDTDASYEESLASVVTADTLNLLPFFSFAGVGFAALVWQASLPERIEPLAGGLAVLAVGLPVAGAIAWRFRRRVGYAVVKLLRPVTRRTPVVNAAGLLERMRDLNAAFQRIARDRRALAYALVFAYVGWLFFALPLYFAGFAVGVPIGLLLVLFIVPASTLAGLTPSPGGSGAVVPVLAVLLLALTGVTGEANATAVAIIYRVASYVFTILVGGAAALYVLRRG
jgi:uncharacterized protein (TIRG00374 family)